MLKSNVGYSINENSFAAGQETAMKASVDLPDTKLGFLFTSIKNDIKQVVQGIKNVTDTPIIGCTSSGAVIVPDGIISSDNGFAGMLILSEKDMNIKITKMIT